MALVAFVDDSKMDTREGTEPQRAWFGYGALLVEDQHLPTLDAEFDALKTRHGFPRRRPLSSRVSLDQYREAKYSPGRSLWMRNNLIEEARTNFFRGAAELIESLGGRILLSFYDEKCDDCGEHEAKKRALENLYERFPAIVEDLETGVVIVVCDFEGSNTQTRSLVEQATGIARFGTWYRSEIREHLYPVLLLGESHLHAGLQIADIAASALGSMLVGEEVYAPPVWDAVRPLLYRRSGTAGGWGVKVRTNRAGTLYRRLFP